MAGGKKKTMANKLAKMSDEERARYLQHRADMEEEAKRRKEQLIATFMKKKIKKEDAFARLNLAKINQNWHQIMRKTKCQEMKENVGHLRAWIERVLNYKNRTISKLMEELEEAEEQYSNNFQCHSTHIDNVIEEQHKYIEKLQTEYEEDLCDLLEKTRADNNLISRNSQTDVEHLMTVLHRQQTEGQIDIREQYDNYMKTLYEMEYEFQEEMTRMKESKKAISGALWKQIAAVVRLYVQQTDSNRMHLAELQRRDAESAVEIAENGERIRQEELLIANLQRGHEHLLSDREAQIKRLESQLEHLNKTFLRCKQNLQKDLQIDEKQLNFLSDCAWDNLQYMETLAKKGEHIKFLAKICKKFETEREKICKYIPWSATITKYEGEVLDVVESLQTITEHFKNAEDVQNSDNVQDGALTLIKYLEGGMPRKKSPDRPKTSISDTLMTSSRSAVTSASASKQITAIKDIRFQSKDSQINGLSSSSSSSVSTSEEESSTDILDRCFESLQKMENFWFTFNKVEIDYMEIKEEKRILEKENKQLRGMIRAVLEAAALSQTIPNSRASTRAPSKRRSAHSAPLRRVVFT